MHNDFTRIALNCTLLQIGNNTVDVPLYEDSVFVNVTAIVDKDLFKVKYMFGKETGKPALYSIDLVVNETCEGYLYNDETEPWLKGRLMGINTLPEDLKRMIAR